MTLTFPELNESTLFEETYLIDVAKGKQKQIWEFVWFLRVTLLPSGGDNVP